MAESCNRVSQESRCRKWKRSSRDAEVTRGVRVRLGGRRLHLPSAWRPPLWERVTSLRSLQNVDSASGPVQSVLSRVFLVAAIGHGAHGTDVQRVFLAKYGEAHHGDDFSPADQRRHGTASGVSKAAVFDPGNPGPRLRASTTGGRRDSGRARNTAARLRRIGWVPGERAGRPRLLYGGTQPQSERTRLRDGGGTGGEGGRSGSDSDRRHAARHRQDISDTVLGRSPAN